MGNTLWVAAQADLRTQKWGSWDSVASVFLEKVSLLKNVLDLGWEGGAMNRFRRGKRAQKRRCYHQYPEKVIGLECWCTMVWKASPSSWSGWFSASSFLPSLSCYSHEDLVWFLYTPANKLSENAPSCGSVSWLGWVLLSLGPVPALMDLIPLLSCLFATHHLKLLILGLFCSCRWQDLLSKGIQKPTTLRPHYLCNHLPIQPPAVAPSARRAAARLFYAPLK